MSSILSMSSSILLLVRICKVYSLPLNGERFQTGHKVGSPKVISCTGPVIGRWVVQVPSLSAQTRCPMLCIIKYLQFIPSAGACIGFPPTLNPRHAHPTFKAILTGGIAIFSGSVSQSIILVQFHQGTFLTVSRLTLSNDNRFVLPAILYFPDHLRHQDVFPPYRNFCTILSDQIVSQFCSKLSFV